MVHPATPVAAAVSITNIRQFNLFANLPIDRSSQFLQIEDIWHPIIY